MYNNKTIRKYVLSTRDRAMGSSIGNISIDYTYTYKVYLYG